MTITIIRRPSANGATIGRLYVNGVPEFYTCEDVVRPPSQKVFGKTAIPTGTYKVLINRSERFSKLAGYDVELPLLLNVPGYAGVRIHAGNFPQDTAGCLLPGTGIGADGASVINSRVAFSALFARMQQALVAGESIIVTIR